MSATVVHARGLRKRYGKLQALDGIDFEIQQGQIVGLIGPNGAGKTTALKAILGLTPFEGELAVLGRDPRVSRHAIMQDVCFIADVAVLPRWLRVSQALEFVERVHPRFSRERAEYFLSRTEIRRNSKVAQLSKGMVTQLHLALVMAIDARLLVLDEPTLGLDILYRKEFYAALLNDYFDGRRTILVTTHQVEEIEKILTHLMFINHGRLVLNESMETVASKYTEVLVVPDRAEAARALGPLHEREMFGKRLFLFEGVERIRLRELGEIHTPSVADLFVAKMRGAAA
ncbi:MAG TPA: ABC transporter ATP-binding protein [Gammaproteobacteria bacterium]|nr:ABC transporter ATP-binding protein [Gammaproteobacteria bacterium]